MWRVAPFDCFSVEWFNVLVQDNDLMEGLKNSLIIGLGVVVLAVPIGLAGALMLSQVAPRLRAWPVDRRVNNARNAGAELIEATGEILTQANG